MSVLIAVFAASIYANSAGPVRMITDEANSVLEILATEQRGEPASDSEWAKLFATDGYRRLKARELGMKRKFEDDDFKKFVQSPELVSSRTALEKTLRDWTNADVGKCRSRALAYLPKGADITAKVYVLIKPLHNSFVWDVSSDPAIMLYLEPGKSQESFANTIAHEMHHIGFGRSCPSPEFDKWVEAQPEPKHIAYNWLGGFGEGAAVLAAAGGLDNEPQASADKTVRDDWQRGMTHQPDQFHEVETFFLQILKGDLKKDQARDKGMTFFGIVGPWYTVGYTMDSTIERAFGRKRLIECYRDPRLMLPAYNLAVKKLGSNSPLWSDEFLAAMK